MRAEAPKLATHTEAGHRANRRPGAPAYPDAKRPVVLNREGKVDGIGEMCHFIEHYLAMRCDGLIYASGDGIFDAKLQPLAKTKAG